MLYSYAERLRASGRGAAAERLLAKHAEGAWREERRP